VFFSVVSIFIIILFLALTKLSSEFKVTESEIEVTRTRIKILNSLVQDLEDSYFEKLVYVAAKNSLIGLSEYYAVSTFGSLEKNLESALTDVIQNRTLTRINNQKVIVPQIKSGYTLQSLTESIANLFKDLNVEIRQLDVTILGVRQKDPWTFEIDSVILYEINDNLGMVSWKGLTNKTVEVSVYGIYGYDLQSGSKSNFEVITESWNQDTSPYTEPSLMKKLSRHSSTPSPGLGLCSSNYCQND